MREPGRHELQYSTPSGLFAGSPSLASPPILKHSLSLNSTAIPILNFTLPSNHFPLSLVPHDVAERHIISNPQQPIPITTTPTIAPISQNILVHDVAERPIISHPSQPMRIATTSDNSPISHNDAHDPQVHFADSSRCPTAAKRDNLDFEAGITAAKRDLRPIHTSGTETLPVSLCLEAKTPAPRSSAHTLHQLAIPAAACVSLLANTSSAHTPIAPATPQHSSSLRVVSTSPRTPAVSARSRVHSSPDNLKTGISFDQKAFDRKYFTPQVRKLLHRVGPASKRQCSDQTISRIASAVKPSVCSNINNEVKQTSEAKICLLRPPEHCKNVPLAIIDLVAQTDFKLGFDNDKVVDAPSAEFLVNSMDSFVAPNKDAEKLTIATYNCNGLANLVSRGFFKRFLVRHDVTILTLSEIKMSLKKLFRFKPLHILLHAFGYRYCYYNPQTTGHGGLHGTAILSKVKPLRVICGSVHTSRVASDKTDNPVAQRAVSSMYEDGRCITAIFDDLAVVNSYTPCSGFLKPGRAVAQVLDRDAFRNQYDIAFLSHCCAIRAQYPSHSLIITGDLNTCCAQDAYYRQDDLAYPGCKPWERQNFALLKSKLCLVDSFRHFHPAPSRADCTYWPSDWQKTKETGQRLDFILGDAKLFDTDSSPVQLLNAYNDPDVRGSDHCPVFAILSLAAKKRPGVTVDNQPSSLQYPGDMKLHKDLVDSGSDGVKELTRMVGDCSLASDDIKELSDMIDGFSLASVSSCSDHRDLPQELLENSCYDPVFRNGNELAFDCWADTDDVVSDFA